MKSPLKWHGGKSYLAKKIIELLPDRSTWHLWREPYFGGGSVTFAIDPSGLSEAVNDIDWELFNFWAVLKCEVGSNQLLKWLAMCPFSESEFNASKFAESQGIHCEDTIKALYFFVRYRQSRQAMGKDFATPTTRIRRGMNENVSAWLSAVEGLPEVHERLKRIEIRNMDAIEFIKKYDHEKAVFYCDPPYMHETRVSKDSYEYEANNEHHDKLLRCLSRIKGRFLLSGYESHLYNTSQNLNVWRRVDIEQPKHSSGKATKETTTECVWMNY